MLDELERAVYVAPTVENMRAYIDALEAHIDDMGDVQKELGAANRRIIKLEKQINDCRNENVRLNDIFDRASDVLGGL